MLIHEFIHTDHSYSGFEIRLKYRNKVCALITCINWPSTSDHAHGASNSSLTDLASKPYLDLVEQQRSPSCKAWTLMDTVGSARAAFPMKTIQSTGDSSVDMIVEDKGSSRSCSHGQDLSRFCQDSTQSKHEPVSGIATHERPLSVEDADENVQERHLGSSSMESSDQRGCPETTISSPPSPMDSIQPSRCCTEHTRDGDDAEQTSEGSRGRRSISNWYTKWVRDWWALEVGSIVLGTFCILAIAVMLLKVDQKEMAGWKLGISIDALLSLLSGFSKSCLLMPTAEALGQLRWPFDPRDQKRAIDIERTDKASRGTWGSVVLLVRARGVTLATLGAAIVLLSLPLDLCFQQILDYPAKYILDVSSNATIARVINYNPPEERQWRGTGFIIAEDTQLATFAYPAWTSNLTTGPGVQFSCPTGTCTYLPFYTIGIDFECKALPESLIQYGCRNISNEWQSFIANGIDNSSDVLTCGYYMDVPNNGLQLMSGYEFEAGGLADEVLAMRIFGLSDVWTNAQYFNGSINFPHVRNRIVDFIIASTPGSFDGVRANRTPVLTECEVHWTVKLVQSEIRNGILQEHALQTIAFENEPREHWDADDGNWYRLSPNITLSEPHSPDQSLTLFVDNTTARKVWQTWAQLVPSSLIENRTFSESEHHTSGQFLKGVSLAALPGAPHLAEILPNLKFPWEASSNISAHMAGIVETMNQVIRNKPLSGTDEYALGQVWRNTVIVDVNWAWFAFPATVWSVAVAFLSITIWRTSKAAQSIRPYKTSLLPMLVDEKEQCSCKKTIPRSMVSLRKMAEVTTLETPPSQAKR